MDDFARVALVASARAQAFRDAEYAFRRSAQIWEEDGTDPCRVRVLRNQADTLAAWADCRGKPDGPALAWAQHLESQSGHDEVHFVAGGSPG